MSVESKLYVGLTVELERNVDFKHVSEFTKKHPELDDEAEGKLALVPRKGEGYNGFIAMECDGISVHLILYLGQYME